MGRTKGAKNKKPARPRTAADKNPAILKLEAIRKALHNYTPGKGDNVIPPPPLPKPLPPLRPEPVKIKLPADSSVAALPIHSRF